MRKNEKMKAETVRKQYMKKLERGEPMCALQVLRLSRGMTQTELAERIGQNQSFIARIEGGTREIGNLTMATGHKIAQALGCTMEDLL